MQPTPLVRATAPTPPRRLLAPLLLLPLLASLTAVWLLDHAKTHQSLFAITNMVGPTTKSLLQHQGLTVTTEDMGTPGNPIRFQAARMPINALVLALGFHLFGDRYLPVAVFKTILFLLPLQLAIYLTWRRTPRSAWRTVAIILLLLAPFAIPAFLADVANIVVEEGYSYSFLALAVALLFFAPSPAHSEPAPADWQQALLFALALDGLYLAKSSMLPAVVVLAVGFFLLNRAAGPRLLVAVLVLAAPIGWTIHQHHASGRYTLGTSLDGINLHKGNNAGFLAHYPPPPGDTIDRFDSDLNHGRVFTTEWTFNDYHQQAALNFALTHPSETLQADARKFYVFFFSLRKVGSSASHGLTRAMEDAGMALFRLILWTAIGCATFLVLRAKSPASEARLRTAARIFLALVAACALPYLAGFAYTRHSSVLIYPSTLLCCRMLVDDR